MYDSTLSKEVQAFALYLKKNWTNSLPTNSYDLVLDVINKEDDEIVWAYYYVDHDSKTLFWQDSYDCGDSLLREVCGVQEASHVKLRLESLYWVHWSLYPTFPGQPTRRFPKEASKQLLGALLSSGISSLTSKCSTSPYSLAEIESMRDFIKEAESLGADNPHVITSHGCSLSMPIGGLFTFTGKKLLVQIATKVSTRIAVAVARFLFDSYLQFCSSSRTSICANSRSCGQMKSLLRLSGESSCKSWFPNGRISFFIQQ